MNSEVMVMEKEVTLFLCGDVMTGRGLDQILPYPSHPELYESYVKDARHYVALAERVNGRINRPVAYTYPWGDAIEFMKEADVRIINLETSITASNHYVDKGINYRMHPKNIPCLTDVDVDCCVLANNHVMDWGKEGLMETLKTLDIAGIAHTGAGINSGAAKAPGVLEVGGKGRVLVFSFGFSTSGIPVSWKAGENRLGVNVLDDLSIATVKGISQQVSRYKKQNDVVIASIHWGGNWGYEIPQAHKKFARYLIDLAKVDVVHGHSSHHFLGIEVHHKKPIIYGCGDVLNDYEGISGHESFKAHLGFLYFVTIDFTSGHLVSLKMVPTEVKKMRITRPGKKDQQWMHRVFNRECAPLGTKILQEENGTFLLDYD